MSIVKHTKAIVVLTSGMREQDHKWRAGFDADLRLRAGIELYKQSKMKGEKPLIIISGGKTEGSLNPDLASVLAESAFSKYKMPKGDVILEKESIDTTENAEFCARILKKNSLENNVEVVTNDYHVKRAVKCFEMYGIYPEGINAERVLYEEPELRKMIDDWKGTPLHVASHIKEFIYRMALYTLGPAPFRRVIHNRIEKFGHR